MRGVTLDEMCEIVRSLASEHGSPADRYFAYAALWDVAGYVQLGDDRGIPVPDGDALRRELEVLLRMLDPRQVPDGYVAVQLVLARLDGLRERAAVIADTRAAEVSPPDVQPSTTETMKVSDVAHVTIVASGAGIGGGSGSASPTIVASGTGIARGVGVAMPTVVTSDGGPPSSAGGGPSPEDAGGFPPLGPDVRSRQPTFAEAQASGMLASLESGQGLWWEHRHYRLRDGRWGSQVCIYEDDGRGLSMMPLYPVATAGYFATPEEARAHNTGMANWYFTVNAPSPSKPFAVATS